MFTIAAEQWSMVALPITNQVDKLVIRPGYLSRNIVVDQLILGDVFELENLD